MSLVGFKAQNHRQQVRSRGPNPQVDDRATSPEVFDPLNERFSFTLDVAASPQNAKCDHFFSIEQNGLEQPWAGTRVWCNPPYSDIGPWVEKAWSEWSELEECWYRNPLASLDRPVLCDCDYCSSVQLIVMLLPANRTEQGWWQDMVEPYRDRPDSPLRVEFIRGRLRFIGHDQVEVNPNERPPFGCCLLVWSKGWR